MNYSFSISTRSGDEYRIMFIDADISLLAENENLVIYYSCDDMNPIPSRNMRGANKELSVQEYRSTLFSHIFDSYMYSHQVSGITNTPIIIKGEEYKQFMHLIARSKHQVIVDLIKDDVIDGWGK